MTQHKVSFVSRDLDRPLLMPGCQVVQEPSPCMEGGSFRRSSPILRSSRVSVWRAGVVQVIFGLCLRRGRARHSGLDQPKSIGEGSMRLRVILLAALLSFAPIIGHTQQPTPAPKCPIAQPDPNAIADIDLMPALAVVPTWSSDPAG